MQVSGIKALYIPEGQHVGIWESAYKVETFLCPRQNPLVYEQNFNNVMSLVILSLRFVKY
jgi:hypothetical protein